MVIARKGIRDYLTTVMYYELFIAISYLEDIDNINTELKIRRQSTIEALWSSRHDVTRAITSAPPRAGYTNASRDRSPSSRLPVLPTHLPLPSRFYPKPQYFPYQNFTFSHLPIMNLWRSGPN